MSPTHVAAKAAPTGFGKVPTGAASVGAASAAIFVGAALAAIFVGAALAAILPSNVSAQDAPFPIAAWSRTTASAEDTGAPTERGAAVFNNWCSACHSRGPLNAPGTTSLQNKYQGALPAALEDRADLTADIIELYVRNGIATMPFYRKTELSDADLAALAAYLVKE